MANEFLPLKGIRVIEMSHMIMGPSSGMFLGFFGAEVIKVEPPHGDKTRGLTGMGAGFFPTFNRGKKSVCLDLKTEAGRKEEWCVVGKLRRVFRWEKGETLAF